MNSIRKALLIGCLCVLSDHFSEAANLQTTVVESTQWEYAQFISQEGIYQWVERDQLVTADSQQTLIRRLGAPKTIDGKFINDLIILNYVATKGWELVSVVNHGPVTLIYTFKRPSEKSD